MLACGKHFPGHGDTAEDSHHELPVLRQDMAALRARELRPFVAAIAAGIPMIMTSHILLPNIDRTQPVTLSHRFNQELLRDELGFQGVIVSDDIGMHAVSHIFDDPSAAVRLRQAGTDMMMICAHWTNTERSRAFAQAIIAAELEGTIPPSLVERSRERIHALLARAPQNAVIALSADIFVEDQHAGPLFAADTVEVI